MSVVKPHAREHRELAKMISRNQFLVGEAGGGTRYPPGLAPDGIEATLAITAIIWPLVAFAVNGKAPCEHEDWLGGGQHRQSRMFWTSCEGGRMERSAFCLG